MNDDRLGAEHKKTFANERHCPSLDIGSIEDLDSMLKARIRGKSDCIYCQNMECQDRNSPYVGEKTSSEKQSTYRGAQEFPEFKDPDQTDSKTGLQINPSTNYPYDKDITE